MADVLIPQTGFETFPASIASVRDADEGIAEDLIAALDDGSRRDVIAIMARLDEPLRKDILEAVDELNGAGAEISALLTIFKGKSHGLQVSDKSVATLRRLFQVVRECLGSGKPAKL